MLKRRSIRATSPAAARIASSSTARDRSCACARMRVICPKGPMIRTPRTLPVALGVRRQYACRTADPRRSPQEPPVAAETSRLRIKRIGDVTQVEFIDRNILDEANIQLIGEELTGLIDAGPKPKLL